MRHLVGLIIFASSVLHAQNSASITSLDLKAICPNNPRCDITAEYPVLIRLDLQNSSKENLECAFNALRATGPYVEMIGAISGKKVALSHGPPSASFDNKFDQIKPGEGTKVDVILYPDDFRLLRQQVLDFDVRIKLDIPGREPVTQNNTRCRGETTIRIKQH